MSHRLDAAALERLFALWNIPLPQKNRLALFALRGCVMTASPGSAGTDGWRSSVQISAAAPDYLHMRCVVGIWDRAGKRLFAAPGSTVPHRDAILKAAARPGRMKGRGANQLEPGYYTDLTKGEHLQGKPQGHAALRQTGYRFYRRTRTVRKAAPYVTARDPLFFGNPYDNLHCAWNTEPGAAGFRSAGCVVVAGWPHSPRLPDAKPNTGAWKTFHDLVYAAPQRTFPLLLLEAADALAALTETRRPPQTKPARAQRPPRLVYGSEGDAVRELQRALKAKGRFAGRVTGKLGVGTYRAWKG